MTYRLPQKQFLLLLIWLLCARHADNDKVIAGARVNVNEDDGRKRRPRRWLTLMTKTATTMVNVNDGEGWDNGWCQLRRPQQFVHVGRWREDGDKVTNLGGNPQKGRSLGQKCYYSYKKRQPPLDSEEGFRNLKEGLKNTSGRLRVHLKNAK